MYLGGSSIRDNFLEVTLSGTLHDAQTPSLALFQIGTERQRLFGPLDETTLAIRMRIRAAQQPFFLFCPELAAREQSERP